MLTNISAIHALTAWRLYNRGAGVEHRIAELAQLGIGKTAVDDLGGNRLLWAMGTLAYQLLHVIRAGVSPPRPRGFRSAPKIAQNVSPRGSGSGGRGRSGDRTHARHQVVDADLELDLPHDPLKPLAPGPPRQTAV